MKLILINKLKYFLCLIFDLGLTINIIAQTTGTFMQVNEIEAGFSYKIFQREFDKEFVDGSTRARWDIPAIYGKYKINEWLSVNLEGAVYFTLVNLIPGRNYINYHMGGGYEALFYKFNGINLHSVAQFDYNVNYDRSEYKYHKKQQFLILELKIEKIFEIEDLKMGVHIGPAYVYNKVTDESPNCIASSESNYNFGAAFGFYVLASESIQIAGQVVYAYYFQPQLAIGYIF